MRKIRFICVGKTQDSYLQEGIRIFEKKLKRFCTSSWIIVKEAAYKKGNMISWLDDENERLSKLILPGNYKIACHDKGKSFTSTQFSDLIQSIGTSGFSQIDFFIGGAFGLPENILKAADLKLSLSAMTFTHQMVRLVLIEQVYRAYTILNHIKYHHE